MKCKSGKSNVIANLLSREEYYEGIFDIIIIVPPTVKIDKSSQLYFRCSSTVGGGRMQLHGRRGGWRPQCGGPV